MSWEHAHRGIVGVTGALGFVGQAVCRALAQRRWAVVGLARNVHPAHESEGVHFVEMGDLRSADWWRLLDGLDAVVHLAGRAHIQGEVASALPAYRETNVVPTRELARAALRKGIHRVVYVSSIKANGEGPTSSPYGLNDPLRPSGPYALSKVEAERAIIESLNGTDTAFTIIRPPLVYGPGVRANFLRLMQVVDRGLPLPLAAVDNRRSLVYVANLADLIGRCLESDDSAHQILFASDDEDLSTPELVRAIARALGRPARLVPVPPALLHAGARLARRTDVMRRLCDSLTVDISHTRKLLGWTPPWRLSQGLDATAHWYASCFSRGRRFDSG